MFKLETDILRVAVSEVYNGDDEMAALKFAVDSNGNDG
jgi:hypothetical protein